MRRLTLEACGCRFEIRCPDAETVDLIGCVFDDFLGAPADTVHAKTYEIGSHGSRECVTVAASDGSRHVFDNPADLIFHLDKDITIELQRRRPELLFVHGAVLVRHSRAVILAAPAGTGKSTFTFAALQNGLDFFSDELAPVDLRDFTVHSYRRALHLKSRPPLPYSLPEDTIFYGTSCYVPAPARLNDTHRMPAQIAAVVFLRRESSSTAGLRVISRASGAAHVMANGLNLLAHEAVGLDAAVALSQAVPCFEVDVTDLESAVGQVKDLLCPDLSATGTRHGATSRAAGTS